MSFEQEMKNIEESWVENPIPDDFLTEYTKKMCSVDGILQQISELRSGHGIVYAAVMRNDNVEVKQLSVFKQ